VVREHYAAIYRYAFRLTGAAQDAEDLTQQAFLLAQRKLHQLREPDKVNRWLFAILRSCYLKGRRRQRPVPAASLELNVDEIPAESVRQLQQQGVDEERLQRALDDMPNDFKVVLLMFYFEGLSYKEIAARANIKMGTVMSRLSRAKGWLRRCLITQDEQQIAREHLRKNRSQVQA
jgi:RNA polymerase sigma-70 factor (ECF subfamily)